MTWAQELVLKCVRIDPETATVWEQELAELALERCYYIDRAAEYMLSVMVRRRNW